MKCSRDTCARHAAPDRKLCVSCLAANRGHMRRVRAGKAARARQLEREQCSADGAQCPHCEGVGHRQHPRVSLAEIARLGLFCRSCRGSGKRRDAVRPQQAERVWEAVRAA